VDLDDLADEPAAGHHFVARGKLRQQGPMSVDPPAATHDLDGDQSGEKQEDRKEGGHEGNRVRSGDQCGEAP
jgi:hypothetical protein